MRSLWLCRYYILIETLQLGQSVEVAQASFDPSTVRSSVQIGPLVCEELVAKSDSSDISAGDIQQWHVAH